MHIQHLHKNTNKIALLNTYDKACLTFIQGQGTYNTRLLECETRFFVQKLLVTHVFCILTWENHKHTCSHAHMKYLCKNTQKQWFRLMRVKRCIIRGLCKCEIHFIVQFIACDKMFSTFWLAKVSSHKQTYANVGPASLCK